MDTDKKCSIGLVLRYLPNKLVVSFNETLSRAWCCASHAARVTMIRPMSEPESAKLAYVIEPRPPWYRRQRVHRALFGILLAVCTFITFFFGGAIALKEYEQYKFWRNIQHVQQACIDYAPPFSQIVVDDDPADFNNLRRSDPCYSLQGGSRLANRIRRTPPISQSLKPSEACQEPSTVGFKMTRR